MAIHVIETSKEELEARKGILAGVKDVITWKTAIFCSCCRTDIKTDIISGNLHTHPLLGTLICRKCEEFYGNPNDFSVDEDGSDKYCRWCGQGGNIYGCSKCPRVFCKKCIKSNVSRTYQDEIHGNDWLCYCCNSKPLWELRAAASLAEEYCATHVQKRRSRINDDEYHPPNEKKPKRVGKSEAIPTVKHAYSGARRFNTYIQSCTNSCQTYINELDNMSQKMRRVVTAESAGPVIKSLTGHFDKLVANINECTKTLQKDMKEWEEEWERKVKEEKDMEAKGELVDGRIVISKKKKVNKKLAATAGGGDSSEEDNDNENSADESKPKMSEKAMAIKSPKKRYLAANDDSGKNKAESESEDDEAPKVNGKLRNSKKDYEAERESSSEVDEPATPRGKRSSKSKKTPRQSKRGLDEDNDAKTPKKSHKKKSRA